MKKRGEQYEDFYRMELCHKLLQTTVAVKKNDIKYHDYCIHISVSYIFVSALYKRKRHQLLGEQGREENCEETFH